jgi:hypothetical protein
VPEREGEREREREREGNTAGTAGIGIWGNMHVPPVFGYE